MEGGDNGSPQVSPRHSPRPARVFVFIHTANYVVSGINCRHPPLSADDLEVPEIDLGDPSALALYLALHQTELQPEPDHEEPPDSEQAHEAVPEEDQTEPAPSAQAV